MSTKKTQDVKTVIKSNRIITSSYRLGALEQRLIAVMIADIQPEDMDFKLYEYNIQFLKKTLGVEGNAYHNIIKKITYNLITKAITIKEEDKTIQVAWLSLAEYDNKKGTVKLMFMPHLKPYLLQLKECFTKYRLQNILKLRSKYSFRIYELLKQYESIGARKFEVEELRELVGLYKNELKRWSNFKQRVIETAVKEINEKTDLKIEYKIEKEGRKIKYITFIIINKEAMENIDKLLKLIPEENRGGSEKIIKEYLIKKGYSYVYRNILYTNRYEPKKYTSFLASCLKNDWGIEIEEEMEQEKIKKEKKGKIQQEINKLIKKYKNKEIIWNNEKYIIMDIYTEGVKLHIYIKNIDNGFSNKVINICDNIYETELSEIENFFVKLTER